MNRKGALGLALLAGGLLPLQVGMNTMLGQHAGGAIFGALGSFALGTVVITLLITTGALGRPQWVDGVRHAPRWAWFSGLCGAFYITSTILVTPTIGLAVASASIIAGQLSSALIVDNFGWISFPLQPLNWVKVAGAVVLFGSVILLLQGSALDISTLPLAGLVFLGGVCLTISLGLNNTLREHFGVPAAATLINFAVGLAALALLSALGIFGTPDLQGAASTPWWGWGGGLIGIVYLMLVIITSPVIGASLTSAAVIAGQMVVSLVLDQLSLFGLAAHAITPLRVLGLGLLAVGVWAVQWKRNRPPEVVPSARGSIPER